MDHNPKAGQDLNSSKMPGGRKVKMRGLNGKNVLGSIFSIRNAMIIIAIVQVVLAYLLINPINLFENYVNIQIIDEVADLTTVNPSEVPVIVPIDDAEQLRSENEIQAEIYKDAQSGDYALIYSDKMIIYRRGDEQVIYNGDTPTQAFNKSQNEIIQAVIQVAKNEGLLAEDSTENPQIIVVVNREEFLEANAVNTDFYNNVQVDDMVAIFPSEGVIMIYRPSQNQIVNSGELTQQII